MYKWVIIYLSFSIVFTAGAFGKGEKQAAADFYYSAPFNLAAGQSSVASRLGIYDSTWSSLQVDSTGAAKIETGRDTLWLAAHRLAIAPGNYLFALSLGLPGLRAVDHGKSSSTRTKGRFWK